MLWWKGPQWLVNENTSWPVETPCTQTPDSQAEQRKTAQASMIVQTRQDSRSIAAIICLSSHSNLLSLFRITAWVLRFARNCSTKTSLPGPSREKCSALNLERIELAHAELQWIKVAQFALKEQDNFKQLKHKFGLKEIDGCLRCVGRLAHADLEPETINPIILPSDHELTKLIIRKCHERVHHCGVRATLTELRTRYWVLKGRQAVKKIVNGCVICKRWQGPPYSAPKEAPLP